MWATIVGERVRLWSSVVEESVGYINWSPGRTWDAVAGKRGACGYSS